MPSLPCSTLLGKYAQNSTSMPLAVLQCSSVKMSVVHKWGLRIKSPREKEQDTNIYIIPFPHLLKLYALEVGFCINKTGEQNLAVEN